MFKRFMIKITAMMICVLLLAASFPIFVEANAANTASFTFVGADRTTVNAGQTITFTVRTIGANYVFANVGGAPVPGTRQADSIAGQTNWSITVSPMVSQNIAVFANTANNMVGAASFSVPVTVQAAVHHQVAAPQMQQQQGVHRIYSITETQATVANSVTLTIVTDINSGSVWLTTEPDRHLLAERVSQDATRSTWTVTYRPRQFVPHEVQISANHDFALGRTLVTERFSVRLIAPFVRPATAAINNLRANPQTVDYDRASTITVRTNLETEYVWAQIDGRRVNARRDTSTATQRTWTIQTPRLRRTETIRVYANTTDNVQGAASDTIRITVRGRGESDARIISSPSPSDIREHQWTTIEVRTNEAATHVFAYQDGRRIATGDRMSTSGNERRWEIRVNPTSIENITIYANSSNSRSGADSRTVRVDRYRW